MTLIIHDDMDQRSPSWYAARCGVITASAVGKLLTPTLKVADNDTSRGLTAGLAAERITRHVEETFRNDDMMRGILHEPIARDLYAKHHKAEVVEVGFMVRAEPTWTLGFSPDGLVGDDGLIEVKCPRAKGHLTTILSGGVPDQHMPQCQAGLLVSGRKWLDYVSFCAGLPLFVTRVHADATWQAALIAAAEKFETACAEMVANFATASADLPTTERDPLEIRVA